MFRHRNSSAFGHLLLEGMTSCTPKEPRLRGAQTPNPAKTDTDRPWWALRAVLVGLGPHMTLHPPKATLERDPPGPGSFGVIACLKYSDPLLSQPLRLDTSREVADTSFLRKGAFPDLWEDPKSRAPNSGLQNPYSVDYRTLGGDLLFGSAQASGISLHLQSNPMNPVVWTPNLES